MVRRLSGTRLRSGDPAPDAAALPPYSGLELLPEVRMDRRDPRAPASAGSARPPVEPRPAHGRRPAGTARTSLHLVRMPLGRDPAGRARHGGDLHRPHARRRRRGPGRGRALLMASQPACRCRRREPGRRAWPTAWRTVRRPRLSRLRPAMRTSASSRPEEDVSIRSATRPIMLSRERPRLTFEATLYDRRTVTVVRRADGEAPLMPFVQHGDR